jgi:murein DD-endopeptidase MepM/ murein hydrolase activator NlpD
MRGTKFTYNHKTLRFEKAKLNWLGLLSTLLGLMVTGAVFFVGIIFLQNEFFETELERNLRNENKALAKHKLVVEVEIAQANLKLSELVTKDKALHKRILLTEDSTDVKKTKFTKESLVTNLSAFDDLIEDLKKKTSDAFNKAKATSYEFSKLYWPVKGDMEELTHYPTLPPVPAFKAEMLVCGYGNQINPFNKLLYEHKGIDIAAEKGSPALASAAGKVAVASHSSLPTGLGNYLVIDHGNGYRTTYAHLQDITVNLGQKIAQGQPIGTVGMSGGVIAPHLHFEISKNEKTCNPIQFLIKKTDVPTFMAMHVTNKSTKQALD